MRLIVVAAAAAFFLPAHQHAVAQSDVIQDVDERVDHQELAALFASDQADRARIARDNPARLRREDAQRRARTRELLDAGALTTAQDYFHAAIIFQHGTDKQDYLLAHVLATLSAKMGRPDTHWLIGTTLDRYLLAAGEDQIFGSQRQRGASRNFDRDLVPDQVQGLLEVPRHIE